MTIDDISKGLSLFSMPSCFLVVRFNGWSQSVVSGADTLVVGISGGRGGNDAVESLVL